MTARSIAGVLLGAGLLCIAPPRADAQSPLQVALGKYKRSPLPYRLLLHDTTAAGQTPVGVVTADSAFIDAPMWPQGEMQRDYGRKMLETSAIGDLLINPDITLVAIESATANGSWQPVNALYNTRQLPFMPLRFAKTISLQHILFKNEYGFHNVDFFRNAVFGGPVIFNQSRFNQIIQFFDCRFDAPCNFDEVHFDGLVNFTRSHFATRADFDSAHFAKGGIFTRTVFNERPDFTYARFDGPVILTHAELQRGADFSNASFGSRAWLELSNLNYPDGTLLISWDSIQKIQEKKIRIAGDLSPDERMARLEEVYSRLARNYGKQEHLAWSEQVMMEINAIKQDYLWEQKRYPVAMLQSVYGAAIGYGYRPFRFMMILMLIVLLYAVAYWMFFYPSVLCIVNDRITKDQLLERTRAKSRWGRIDHRLSRFNRPAKILQVLWLSTKVFFGVQFQSNWIDVDNKPFVFVLVSQWVLGIIAYTILLLFVVKGIGMADQIRSLFGI